MYKVVFSGFETLEQARALADYYVGQGEQDAAIWFEERTDLEWAPSEKVEEDGDTILVSVRLVPKTG